MKFSSVESNESSFAGGMEPIEKPNSDYYMCGLLLFLLGILLVLESDYPLVGWFFAIASLSFIFWVYLRNRRINLIKSEGKCYSAKILSISYRENRWESDKSVISVVCAYNDASGNLREAKGTMWLSELEERAVFEIKHLMAIVWVDSKNPRYYYVDVSLLESGDTREKPDMAHDEDYRDDNRYLKSIYCAIAVGAGLFGIVFMVFGYIILWSAITSTPLFLILRFSIIPVAWAIIICVSRKRHVSRLKNEGDCYEAEITRVYRDPFRSCNFVVECVYKNHDEKRCLVESRSIPATYARIRKDCFTAKVWVNPSDPKDYYVEVTNID